jgi:hypothetical protein
MRQQLQIQNTIAFFSFNLKLKKAIYIKNKTLKV